jgi:hypothetical protein
MEELSHWDRQALAAYIAAYVMEEQARGNVEIHAFMVRDAIDAYIGGAHDDARDVIAQPVVVHKIG